MYGKSQRNIFEILYYISFNRLTKYALIKSINFDTWKKSSRWKNNKFFYKYNNIKFVKQ